jgi:hypothetical protein
MLLRREWWEGDRLGPSAAIPVIVLLALTSWAIVVAILFGF